MNLVSLIGRLTKDPDIRYTSGENRLCVARYTLAVDRIYKKDGEPTADFITCVAFGKSGEFAENYFKKGIKIAITGRIQTGTYKDKDDRTVYTTDVIVNTQEFCESKKQSTSNSQTEDGFSNINDECPF